MNHSSALTTAHSPQASPQLAIVGMASCWSCGEGLAAFERSLYTGTQHLIPVPPQRWQGLDTTAAPIGGYIQDFELDLDRLQISPEALSHFSAQELLMLQVADQALQDAGLPVGANVAVLITEATDLTVQRLRQPDSCPDRSPAHDYPSSTEKNTAQRIARLWQFTGAAFTLAAEENSVFKALEMAQMLLLLHEVDAVLVGAADLAGSAASVLLRQRSPSCNVGTSTLCEMSDDCQANGGLLGEGAGAVVLKRYATAEQAGNRVYAVVDALSLVETASPLNNVLLSPAQAIAQACQTALQTSGLRPEDIGYLELCGSGVAAADTAEIQGLLQAYRSPPATLSCAIGSVSTIIGHTQGASGIASLIKTALCLYHRYIPATPGWSAPQHPDLWQKSCFYVATASRPWFPTQPEGKRTAALNSTEPNGTYVHLILSECPQRRQAERQGIPTRSDNHYLAQTPFYLLPIAAADRAALISKLHQLQASVATCSNLADFARQVFEEFQTRSQTAYTAVILGHNPTEVQQEIQRALKGVAKALDQGTDWKTPIGSYFTPKPQGKQGTIAFVYPGAFNSYLGLGRDLFRLFPKLYEHSHSYVSNPGAALQETLLYPRSLQAFSKRQLEGLEQQLMGDALAMLNSGMGFAVLYTAILRDYFQLQPQRAFGYSVGEISMVCAHSVWRDYETGNHQLTTSPLFRSRLSGPKNAVREQWGLPPAAETESGDFWSTYVLMAPREQVEADLQAESRVYLTQINTPNEIVISGETAACQRVIAKLGCDAFRAPATNVIHCQVMQREYPELVKLHVLPIQQRPATVFYSSANYQPMTLESLAVAKDLAKGLCQPLDFPRLVDRVYEDGARIFIESGAGSTCSRWIGDILKGKDHVTVSLNKRGMDDHSALLRSLAKLVSHQVPLDLSPLYAVSTAALARSTTLITLGQHQRTRLPLSSLSSHPSCPPYLEVDSSMLLTQERSQIVSNRLDRILSNGFTSPERLASPQVPVTRSPVQEPGTTMPETPAIVDQPTSPSLPNPSIQLTQFCTNHSHANQGHAAFLNARQSSLMHISQLIQLQIAVSQQLINSPSEPEFAPEFYLDSVASGNGHRAPQPVLV